MANEYLTPSGNPATGSSVASAPIRANQADVEAAFDKLPALAGNGDYIVTVNVGGTALTSVSASTARTKLGLVIGTHVQAYDATLASLAALGTAADKFAYTTGTDTWAEGTITAAGRAILDDATAADQRATLGAAGLGANTFTGAQILSDQQVSRAMFLDCGYTYLDKGNSGTSTQTLDYTAGSHQRVKATGNFTIATSNWPPTGNLGEILLELVGDGTGRTITWPTINWVKSDGTLTTTFASNGVTLITTDNAPNFCVLWTRDAGTTLYGKFIR